MTTTEEYNGWTNRETWATALHINNDSGLYENVIEQVKNYANEEQPTTGLASEIEQFIFEVLDYENVQSNYVAFSMLTDIGSLYRVNWQEIAESFLSELVKENA